MNCYFDISRCSKEELLTLVNKLQLREIKFRFGAVGDIDVLVVDNEDIWELV